MVNKALALAAISALAEQALAFNSHRHLHQAAAADKRDLVIDWVTVYQTVYFTPGQNSAPAATPVVQEAPVNNIPTVTSTVTSTAAPVAPVVPVVPAPAKPAAVQTTLTKAVKPAAKETPEPVAAVKASSDHPSDDSSSSSKGSSGSSSGLPFSSKRGIAYNDVDLANSFGNDCPSCGWSYNWGSLSDGIDSKFSFVPMLHGDTDDFVGWWQTNAPKCISDGAKALFSFNEPDLASQAGIDPVQAASSHVKHMNKFAGQALIGAPSVSNSGNKDEGLDWLKQFIAACSNQGEDCHFDFCNVHWYSDVQYADTLFTHLEAAHKLCKGKPIWLTEFAPAGSPDQIDAFLKDVIPKLEDLDYLHAYSYYMVSTDSLMTPERSMSSFGNTYATI